MTQLDKLWYRLEFQLNDFLAYVSNEDLQESLSDYLEKSDELASFAPGSKERIRLELDKLIIAEGISSAASQLDPDKHSEIKETLQRITTLGDYLSKVDSHHYS